MLRCILLLCILLALPTVAHADRRVALVIGNGDYARVGKLPNPTRDADAVETLLRSATFDVVEARRNLGVAAMRRALRDFSDHARDADIAVVFYAGHGIEVNGANYLIPVDAALERDMRRLETEQSLRGLRRAWETLTTREREVLQHVVQGRGTLAVERHASVAVMVVQEPTEAFAAHFQAHVPARGFGLGLRQFRNHLRNALALPIAACRRARRGFRRRAPCRAGSDRVEAHQVHVSAGAMLGDLQQVDDAVEAGLPRQLGSDIRHCDLPDRVDFYLPDAGAVVALARLHARRMPDADTAGDVAALDAGTQTTGEIQGGILVHAHQPHELAAEPAAVRAKRITEHGQQHAHGRK